MAQAHDIALGPRTARSPGHAPECPRDPPARKTHLAGMVAGSGWSPAEPAAEFPEPRPIAGRSYARARIEVPMSAMSRSAVNGLDRNTLSMSTPASTMPWAFSQISSGEP